MSNKINPYYINQSSTRLLLLTFLFSSLPHLTRVPPLLVALIVAFALWRLIISRYSLATPGIYLRLSLIIISVVLIFFSHSSTIGREAGLSMLLIMLALKLVEIKTKRDTLLFLYLNYFVVVTNFLYSQSILISLYLFTVVWLITTTIIAVNRQGSEIRFRAHMRVSGLLITQAIPLMLVMFVLFPRISGPLWKLPKSESDGKTGLSENMSPGDISKLIKSNKIAFRVKFTSAIPETKNRYWRGPVLSHFNGRAWTVDRQLSRRIMYHHPKSTLSTYTITLEPNYSKLLPALDTPVSWPNSGFMSSEHVIYAFQTVNNRFQYQLSSSNKPISRQTLPGKIRNRYLQLPQSYNPLSTTFISNFRRQHPNDISLVNNLLQYFRNNKFIYTLQPPKLGKHSVDEFMFKTRRGFCEHYANAFVVMMRMAKIPARVVTGYQGGVYNKLGDYFIVRQSDAHAWAEVWIDNQGWRRIDPTAAVSPDRIERGIEASLNDDSAWTGVLYSTNSRFTGVALYWDNMRNGWNQWVLGYGETLQNEMLAMLGLLSAGWLSKTITLAVIVGGLLLLIALYYRYRDSFKRVEKSQAIYNRFCRKLSSADLPREPWEGPKDYVIRISAARADLHTEADKITKLYIQIRYADQPSTEKIKELAHYVKYFKP